MKFFVASRGQSTIRDAPAGRAGLFSRIHHGDGFSIKKPRHKAGVKSGTNVRLLSGRSNEGAHWNYKTNYGSMGDSDHRRSDRLQIVVSFAGLGIMPGAAMAVTEQSLKVQADPISGLEARLRPVDSRTEKLAA